MRTTARHRGGRSDSREEVVSVQVCVASLNTSAATELCIRSMREFADHPFALVVGDSGSTDGSLEMLRLFEARGWLSLEVAPEGRGHGEWLDLWHASCTSRLAVFVDSDVEFRRAGWLSRLVAAWSGSGAALVCSEFLAGLTRFVEPVGSETVRAAPRPAPWLLMVDVEQTRSIGASFTFDKEWAQTFPERLVYDVGARVYQAVRANGFETVEMPRSYGRLYHHYGGLSWIPTRGRRGEKKTADLAAISARLKRLRASQA
jgi:glycosyltransferase involved in cell wall biosynthesis